jgi:hypothetical protein
LKEDNGDKVVPCPNKFSKNPKMVVDPIWVLISKVQNDRDTQHTPGLDSVDVGCIVFIDVVY